MGGACGEKAGFDVVVASSYLEGRRVEETCNGGVSIQGDEAIAETLDEVGGRVTKARGNRHG